MVNIMLKKYFLTFVFFIGFFSIILPFNPVRGDPFIITETTDLSLNYGDGYFAEVHIGGLERNSLYILMVANNTADAYNISFRGTLPAQIIHVDYKGTLQDIYGNQLNELQIILVESTTIHFTHYIMLNYDRNLATIAQWVVDLFIFTLFIGLSGFLVIFIGKRI